MGADSGDDLMMFRCGQLNAEEKGRRWEEANTAGRPRGRAPWFPSPCCQNGEATELADHNTIWSCNLSLYRKTHSQGTAQWCHGRTDSQWDHLGATWNMMFFVPLLLLFEAFVSWLLCRHQWFALKGPRHLYMRSTFSSTTLLYIYSLYSKSVDSSVSFCLKWLEMQKGSGSNQSLDT